MSPSAVNPFEDESLPSKSASRNAHSLLHVSGTHIVDETGEQILLKGTALGGHLNMENFITGYTGHEHEHRAAMARVLGKEKAAYFFDRFLHYFFTDADAEFFASLGLNCIRVPFNYRHFIDDEGHGSDGHEVHERPDHSYSCHSPSGALRRNHIEDSNEEK